MTFIGGAGPVPAAPAAPAAGTNLGSTPQPVTCTFVEPALTGSRLSAANGAVEGGGGGKVPSRATLGSHAHALAYLHFIYHHKRWVQGMLRADPRESIMTTIIVSIFTSQPSAQHS